MSQSHQQADASKRLKCFIGQRNSAGLNTVVKLPCLRKGGYCVVRKWLKGSEFPEFLSLIID